MLIGQPIGVATGGGGKWAACPPPRTSDRGPPEIDTDPRRFRGRKKWGVGGPHSDRYLNLPVPCWGFVDEKPLRPFQDGEKTAALRAAFFAHLYHPFFSHVF